MQLSKVFLLLHVNTLHGMLDTFVKCQHPHEDQLMKKTDKGQAVSMTIRIAKARANGNLLYKAEKPSVCLSVLIFWCHAANSVISAWIDLGLDLCDSCGLWHVNGCCYE